MCSAAFCSSTLPSTETPGAAQSRNEKPHSQLSRPARWRFHQTKPGWRQLLNYLTLEISNSVAHFWINECDTHQRCWKSKTVFWDDEIWIRGCVERDNTLTLIAAEIFVVFERIRTQLLSSRDLLSNGIVVRNTAGTKLYRPLPKPGSPNLCRVVIRDHFKHFNLLPHWLLQKPLHLSVAEIHEWYKTKLPDF